MNRSRPTVAKVGGSLLGDPVRLRAVLRELADGACIMVPGGGPFADAVREAQGAGGFSDALAHRLALDAMGHMAQVFSEIEPRLAVEREIAALARCGRPLVWDPAALKAGRPDIPESWDVTSDSLALWLAREIGARTCCLVKSADAPPGTDAGSLSRLGLVDAAFPVFAERYDGRIVLRGPGCDRIVAAREGRAAA